ncbi:MAG: tetratricopeptide repeat protein [Thermoguttaceae bacterium]
MSAGSAAIVLLTFFAYLPCLNGGFIWDDDKLLTDNELIKAPDGLYSFWFTTKSLDYWPVTNSSLWIEWRLWGMNPTGYHATNVFLHIVEALLIWMILQRLSIPGAFLAALIFALHPVNVESVAWISQRKGMLAMLFSLLSIMWYMKFISPALPGKRREQAPGLNRQHKQSPRGAARGLNNSPLSTRHSSLFYWLSLAAFILATLSKGSEVVVPAVLLGIIWWIRGVTRRDLLRIAPFFLIAVVMVFVNLWFRTHDSGEEFRDAGVVERLLGAGAVVWFCLYKALFPLNLSYIYPLWKIEPKNFLWWLPLSAAVIVTAVLLFWRKGWSKPLLFAWGFFCVSLIPVLGFVDVGYMRYSLVADHYQHLAIIGVIAAATAGWGRWFYVASPSLRWKAVATAIVAVCALALLTREQSALYRNGLALYSDALKKNPDSWLVHFNLGGCLGGQDRTHEAIKEYRKALELNTIFPAWTNYNLGTLLAEVGRVDEAIDCYRRALSIQPNFPEVQNNWGIALAKVGSFSEATEHYKQALRLCPSLAESHYNIGVILAKTGHPEEAIKCFDEALRLKPNYIKALNDWGSALGALGRWQEALETTQRALRLERDNPTTLNSMGFIPAKMGRFRESMEFFKKSVRQKPDYLDAWINLTLVYGKSNQRKEAIAAAHRALELARASGDTRTVKKIEDWLKTLSRGIRD